jgi:energy-coupling factor transporter transmembrane protein EcfT
VIDVAWIDHWAAAPPRRGPFHRASVFSKIIFLILVVAAAVMAKNPAPLAVGYAVMLLAAAASRLPWSNMLMFSLYPAVFALLYGISLRGGVWLYSLLLIKAVAPAFAMVTLIVSDRKSVV